MKKTFLTSSTILCLLSTVFLMGLSFKIQPVKASSTICIRTDGSVDPPDASIWSLDNVTYTFTDNIYDEVVVERSNIIIDGNGYILQGSGSGSGLYLSGINNVTIKNTNIKGFYDGVYLYQSPHNRISGNNITGNKHAGIYLTNSVNCTIARNVCFSYGMFPWGATGIFITNSGNSTIVENQANNNGAYGIELSYSGNCELLKNSANSNRGYGIIVHASNSCNIVANTASYNTLAHGDAGGFGIRVRLSNGCTISGNIVANNDYVGLAMDQSENNIIYHNNFIDNTFYQARSSGSNVWDNGHPSGGNYWNNYKGVDLYSGPYQNETGYDWIGDTPKIIKESNRDNYPLMDFYVPETEEVRIAYRELLGNYNKLQSDFKSLNSTHHTLLSNYSELQGNYESLQRIYDNLQSSYYELSTNFNSLNSTYNNLVSNYTNIQSSYDQLQSDQEAIISELNAIRNLMYIFMATTIILIATTVYFAIIKPKTKP